MNGEGVEKDEAKGARVQGSEPEGRRGRTYYYAGCLENGLGVKPNAAAAKALFQKAAAAGHSGAIEWCKSPRCSGKTAAVIVVNATSFWTLSVNAPLPCFTGIPRRDNPVSRPISPFLGSKAEKCRQS